MYKRQDPQYTGKENIYLYGAMLGYTKKFIDSKYDEIVEFSELQKFMDVPVKNYSSGMKSRLGFSIATVVEPKILILDDSTSAVDTATEAKIRESFSGLLKETTKIIIAQRITSVMEADEILVLDEGEIVGKGTHEELLKTCEAYQEIYYSQMDKEASAS